MYQGGTCIIYQTCLVFSFFLFPGGGEGEGAWDRGPMAQGPRGRGLGARGAAGARGRGRWDPDPEPEGPGFRAQGPGRRGGADSIIFAQPTSMKKCTFDKESINAT